MTTRIEEYMNTLFTGKVDPYSGFLGAYNMGVWGVSISDKPPLEQGLLVSGEVLENVPTFTHSSKDNPKAQNYVKYYDTPNLWGFGDNPNEWGYVDKEWARKSIRSFRLEDMDKKEDAPWSEIATISKVQNEMDRVGAWSALVDRWRAVIAQSTQLVDITSLSPPYTGHVAQIGICKGIAQCLEKWLKTAESEPQKAPALMIRILFGQTAVNMPGAKTEWNAFRAELEKTLKPYSEAIKNSGAASLPVILYGSDLGRKIATFNHSKIVAGDGQYAVVGGHNMCEEVSSNKAPVIHDLTCEVTGPGAKSANAFAGSLWLKAAESGRLWIHHFQWSSQKFIDLSYEAPKKWAPNNWVEYGLGSQKEVPKVLKNQTWYYPMETLPVVAACKPPDGSVPATAIMGIGRWGNTSVFGIDCSAGLKSHSVEVGIPPVQACHYASDILKRILIVDKKNTAIRMSQQDLVNNGFFGGLQKDDHTICELLGKRLAKYKTGTAIQIVVSSRYTQNCEGYAYSYGDGPREAAERISDAAAGKKQLSSTVGKLPERLEVLELDHKSNTVPYQRIKSDKDPSFCTIAPLVFCEAREATRDRGSYVWPDAKYVWDRLYSNNRFWNKKDKAELKFGPGNHSKVMFVSTGEDNATGLVMIGSDNMYPSPLSEFSFIIEGEEAITQFRKQYWDKLWGYSARFGFTVQPDGTVI